MQQDFTADKVNCRPAEKQHQLGNKDEPYKTDVFSLYSCIDDGLRKEREYQLQDAPDKQPQNQLREKTFVFQQVFPKEFQAILRRNGITLFFVKRSGGFKQQGYTFFFAVGLCTNPILAEFFLRENNAPFTRIRHIHIVAGFLGFLNVIHHYKMFLFPMYDAGEQGFFRQLVESDASTHGFKSDVFCCTADTKQ